MSETAPIPPQKSLVERVLSLITDVRAGEGVTALLLTLNVFCLLALYSVLKPVRSALILSESGAVAQSYAAAAQASLLLFLVPLYGKFASLVNRVRLISFVTLFFAANLLVFYALGLAGARIGIAFYIWLGIFNMMAPAQLWAFANDVYSQDRGRRLFPLVGIGGSLGAWIGAEIASALFGSLGPYRLMLFGVGGLVICMLITIWVHRREQRRDKANEPAGEAEQPLGKAGGFQLIFKQRYLLYIALLMIVLNTVNTIGEFLLASLVETEAVKAIAGAAAGTTEANWIGSFMARFQANVNLLGLLLQMFVVSRIFKYIGVRGALFIQPAIALLSYTSMAFLPVLSIVRVAKTMENSSDYSIQNTTRQALYLPTSREAKYKAKQAIDAFFVRFGDMLQAVVVFIGTSLAFTTQHYALLNIAMTAVWFVLAMGIASEHRKLTAAEEPARAA
ncbi:MAG TPA: Npt1/Npt2 family nucleotide transporter [Vicinamibacterales bacterium]